MTGATPQDVGILVAYLCREPAHPTPGAPPTAYLTPPHGEVADGEYEIWRGGESFLVSGEALPGRDAIEVRIYCKHECVSDPSVRGELRRALPDHHMSLDGDICILTRCLLVAEGRTTCPVAADTVLDLFLADRGDGYLPEAFCGGAGEA